MNAIPGEIGLIISDPFDFPFRLLTVVIQESKEDVFLLKLERRVAYRDCGFIQLLAYPRNNPQAFVSPQPGQRIVVNLTPIIGRDVLSLEDCLKVAGRWRGWFLLGTIEIYDGIQSSA